MELSNPYVPLSLFPPYATVTLSGRALISGMYVVAVSLWWAAMPIFLWWQSSHHARRWEAKGQDAPEDERRTLVYQLADWGCDPDLHTFEHGCELRYKGDRPK